MHQAGLQSLEVEEILNGAFFCPTAQEPSDPTQALQL